MTNRDDTADPVALPTVPTFPLVAFRQKLAAMDVEDLRKYLAQVHRLRQRLGDTPPVGLEVRWYRLVQACQMANVAYSIKQSAPSPDPAAAVSDGDALVDGVASP